VIAHLICYYSYLVFYHKNINLAISLFPKKIEQFIKNFIMFLDKRDLYFTHRDNFILNTKILDNLRNENFLSLFPELEIMVADDGIL